MSALFASPPLQYVQCYDPSYQVPVCLDQPLHVDPRHQQNTTGQFLALCGQLELLCQKELHENSYQHIQHGQVSALFESRATLIVDQLQKAFTPMAGRRYASVLDVLEHKGVGRLYPRAMAYLRDPQSFNLKPVNTAMDTYTSQMSMSQRLLSLAQQMQCDVGAASTNHKYLTHQLCVLHQLLKGFEHVPPLVEVKQSLEQNFGRFKHAAKREQNQIQISLPDPERQWLYELTSRIIEIQTGYASDLTRGPVEAGFRLVNYAFHH